jgi:hypothetical protein
MPANLVRVESSRSSQRRIIAGVIAVLSVAIKA